MNSPLGLILTGVVIFQLLFISFFLFTSVKGKRLSNSFLGTLFLLLAVNLIDMLLSSLGLNHYYLRIALLDDAFVLIYGPLTLFYTKSIVYKDFQLSRTNWLHFLPYVLITLFLVISQNISAPSTQAQLLEDINNFEMPWHVNVVLGLFFLVAALYIYQSYRHLTIYRNVITDQFSDTDQINLKWLNFTLRSLAIFGIIATAHSFIPLSFLDAYFEISIALLLGFLFYFITTVLLKALKHPTLFQGIDKSKRKSYSDSIMSDDMLENYKSRLQNHMESNKSFLDPNLTIDTLSKELDLHPKKLSEIINRAFNKNFFHFINDHRIDTAKTLLVNSVESKLTILEILYQSGFNSKSSFNTLFKKKTGQTPTEFKKSQTIPAQGN